LISITHLEINALIDEYSQCIAGCCKLWDIWGALMYDGRLSFTINWQGIMKLSSLLFVLFFLFFIYNSLNLIQNQEIKAMPLLQNMLNLDRCPHCSVSKPTLEKIHEVVTDNHATSNQRYWRIYKCNFCGGLVTASSKEYNHKVEEIFPEAKSVDNAIPERAREYLKQSMESSPAGAVMLAASAVDSMLKQKEYKEGNLYDRIEQAVKDHLITEEMAKWAHDVRLDVNDQGHADEEAPLPDEADAKRAIEFVKALAQLLFVLPDRIQRGLAKK